MSIFTSIRDKVESIGAAAAAPFTLNQAKGWTAKSAQQSTLGKASGDYGKVYATAQTVGAVAGAAILAAPAVGAAATGAGVTGASAATAGGKLIADAIKGPSTPQANPTATPQIIQTSNAPAKTDLTLPAVIVTAGLLAIKMLG